MVDCISLLLIFIGWALFIFGYKFREIVLSFLGSGIGAVLIYNIAVAYDWSFYVHIIVSFLVSIMISIICIRYKTVSAVFINSWSAIFLVKVIGLCTMQAAAVSSADISVNQQYISFAIYLIAPITGIVYPLLSILIATSFYGVWFVMMGADIYLGNGYPTPVDLWFSQESWVANFKVTEPLMLMAFLHITSTLLAILIQYYQVNQLHLIHKYPLLTDEDAEEEYYKNLEDNTTDPNVDVEQPMVTPGGEYDEQSSMAVLDMYISPNESSNGEIPYFDHDKSYLKDKNIKNSEKEKQPLL